MPLYDYKKLPKKAENEPSGDVTLEFVIFCKQYGMDLFGAGQCESCKHFSDSIYCPAFPNGEGIPIKILIDEVKHNKRDPKQNNEIVFESKYSI